MLLPNRRSSMVLPRTPSNQGLCEKSVKRFN
jgi:hypothetical protein